MNDEVLVKVEGEFCRSLKRSLWYGVQDVTSELMGRPGGHGELRKNDFWAVDDVSQVCSQHGTGRYHSHLLRDHPGQIPSGCTQSQQRLHQQIERNCRIPGFHFRHARLARPDKSGDLDLTQFVMGAILSE